MYASILLTTVSSNCTVYNFTKNTLLIHLLQADLLEPLEMPVNDGLPGKGLCTEGIKETSKVHVGSSSFGVPEEERKGDIQNESLKGTAVRKTA